jgi:nuclease-like protein
MLWSGRKEGRMPRIKHTVEQIITKLLSSHGLPEQVILVDGMNLNSELVKDGWCWWYRKYAPGDALLEGLEKKEAREARKGLWVDPAPLPQFLVRYEYMAVQFVWAVSTSTVPREEVESKIREDLENHPDLHPCHPGVITAQVFSTDPLEVNIAGQLVCTCGESFAQFSGSSDGSRLTYYE